jgi:hypothetical protein
MPEMFIKDLIALPEQVNRGDFVLRLTEGVAHPDATVDSYVVTEQLQKSFDAALAIIKSAVEGKTSKAAYLHGSFGSGKSHFMAVLHLILQGNVRARSIPELAGVIAKHNGWLEGKRFLLVPFHLIGAKNMESAVLGGYVRHVAKLHPDAPTPAVYRSEKLIADADALRGTLGDAKFFEALNGAASGQQPANGGWGEVSSTWDAQTYSQARDASAESAEHRQLVGDLIDTFFTAMRQTDEFVSLDEGLAVLSAHAKSQGYDSLILFLDELILWLASHAADVNFVSTEAQKVPKLVESERGDRPVPIISFVARQRDLRELIGQHITGAERLGFSDVLSYWEGRFGLIKLEDRNLPVITEKRILRPINAESRRLMDEEFKKTAATREEVMRVLLTSTGNRDDFRKLYPFSPALVETLVAVSSLLQRERTALKIMIQLLVKQRDTLRLGQIVPLGDLYDEIAQGDEAFNNEMKSHFENAHRLYHQHLRPVLEQEHGISFEEAEELLPDDAKRRGLVNDDRLVKTLLLAALAPAVESLKTMTPARLAALNHGTIKSPIAGQEATTVLNKCKKWAAAVGQIKIQENAGSQPTILLQLSGVDVQSIIDQAEAVDNHGNRIRKLKDLLFGEFGIENQQELFARLPFRWRGTDRECEVLVSNVREVPVETLATGGASWRLIVDYPFDQAGCSVRDDLERLEKFRQEGKPARTICWLPSFLNHKSMEQLGRLVRLDHILTENRFPTFVTHLSEVDRAAARALLENQRDVLRSQFKAQVEMAYGLRQGDGQYLDSSNELELAEHFQSLDPMLTLQPPAASNFAEGLQQVLDQALRNQFPAHPNLAEDTSLTKGVLQKVFEVIQSAVRSSEPSVLVSDITTRKHMLRIANPLRLGEMGENRFQAGQQWKQHFERMINQQGGQPSVSVKTLRKWIEEPKAMGLPSLLEDLIILTFAEQTNRSFLLHGTTVDPQLGALNEETILQETPLPEEVDWAAARNRAKSIFGFDCSPLRNANNVAQLASQIRTKITEQRGAVRSLAKSIEDACRQLALPTELNERITNANAAETLVHHLEQAREDRELITRLGQVKLTVADAALAASIMQAKSVGDALRPDEWSIFLAIRDLTDERRSAAEKVWQDLAETLKSSEHAVALTAKLGELRLVALRLLTRPVRPTPPPPGGGSETGRGPQPPVIPPVVISTPVSASVWVGSDLGEVEAYYGGDRQKIERNRRLVADLKKLYGRSQVEADELPAWLGAEVAGNLLEVHHIKRLADGGPDERSNMIVLTPTLHALVHLDPGTIIDLQRGLLELPKFGLRAKISVKSNHNG